MDYNEFKNRLIERVKERIEGGAEAFFMTRQKANQTEKEGICMQKPDGTQQTVVYIQELYRPYLQTADLEKMADELISIFRESADIPGADILKDWECVKDRLRIRLVKKDWNRERLENWVYIEYLDLAVMLAAELELKGGQTGSVPVEKASLKFWGVSADEAYRKAMENLYREKYYLGSIDKFLPEDFPAGDIQLYVLLRENKNFGAGLMLREDILRQFAEEQGGSFYILPASVHELILLKYGEDLDVCRLREVVKQVNENTALLNPEDNLSDNVYFYDREKQKIEIAQEG